MKCGFILLLLCHFSYSFDYNNTFQLVATVIKARANVIIDKSITGPQCARDLRSLINGIFYTKQIWALQMLDSNVKINPGILYGNIYQLGNYDECLQINEIRENFTLSGQYCGVVVEPVVKDNLTQSTNIVDLKSMLQLLAPQYTSHNILKYVRLIAGICAPSSCTSENLQNLINLVAKTFELPFTTIINDAFCMVKNKNVLSLPIDQKVYYAFTFMLFVVLISTIYDLRLKEKERSNNFGIIFSLHSNIKKLFSTRCENSTITCLYGIRVLSMMWIILCHRYLFTILGPTTNGLELLKNKDQLYNSIFIAGPLSVETFFVLSGVLVTYIFLQQTEKAKVSLTGFFMHRYIRLAPALGATILFSLSILKFLSDGPIWPIVVKRLSITCYHTWWATMLFVNNHLNPSQQCLGHTWYLAIDTQFYFLSPLILYNILKHPKKVLLIMAAVSGMSVAWTFYLAITYNISVLPTELDPQYFLKIYLSAFCRISVWLVGVLIGYLIHKNKSRKLCIPKLLNVAIWTLVFSMMAWLIIIHVTILAEYQSSLISATFHALVRPAWGCCIGMMIFLCCTGNGGFINRFLSNSVFIIVGKLTYSMYLTHVSVQAIFIASTREATHFSLSRVFHGFFGDYFIALGLGGIMCLMFEVPFMSLLQVVGQRVKANKSALKSNEVNGVEASSKKSKFKNIKTQ